MIRKLAAAIIATGMLTVGILISQQTPAAAECGQNIGLASGDVTCSYSGDQAVGMSQNADGHVYTLRSRCDAFSEDINRCKQLARCGPDTPPNYLFDLLQDGKPIGEVCLDSDQASQFGEITPELVLREFKSLDWPSAKLLVQPKGNETLVNFKTLFYTTLAEPATQTITLLGREVLIEATPTSYIWHPDQGADTWETTNPGRPIEKGDDPADLNHYVYEAKGKARPSVDVVYSGRYRIDGGAWQEIPDTVTFVGDPVDLTISEATPVLTGEYN